MKKNNRKIFYSSIAVQFFVAVSNASAQYQKPSSFGLANDMDGMVMNITEWLLGLSAALAVLALIWGGVNYVGSSGDAQKTDLSKKIIYFALIGLVVTGLAFAMVKVLVDVILK